MSNDNHSSKGLDKIKILKKILNETKNKAQGFFGGEDMLIRLGDDKIPTNYKNLPSHIAKLAKELLDPLPWMSGEIMFYSSAGDCQLNKMSDENFKIKIKTAFEEANQNKPNRLQEALGHGRSEELEKFYQNFYLHEFQDFKNIRPVR